MKKKKSTPPLASYEDAPESERAVLHRGLAHLAARGISTETILKHGVQIGSVNYDMIQERLGKIDPQWARAVAAIWFPVRDRNGKQIGWIAEAVLGD